MNLSNNKNNLFLLSPFLGMVIFFILYGIATTRYPGSTWFDNDTVGFSVIHNYWCDLMGEKTYDFRHNPGSPIAIAAWIVLCLSLSIFWSILPRLFNTINKNQRIIPYTGIFTMLVAVFLFSKYHDFVLYFGGVFGLSTLILTMIELRKAGYLREFKFLIFCFFMCLCNYFFYTLSLWLIILPLFQKITFLCFFIGLGMINLQIYHKAKSNY